MQLLAAVDGDGATSFAEGLTATVPRIRRGMTAIVITASLDRGWVKPLATLRTRGVGCVAITLDIPAFEGYHEAPGGERGAATDPESPTVESTSSAQQSRALRHALAEYDIPVYVVGPTTPLAKALAS
jgi:hypothetical protein